MTPDLPAGLLTFAFVDVVESTSLLREHGDAFVAALIGMHDLVASVTAGAGGTVVQTEGDGAFLVFPDADDAIRGLLEIQGRLAEPPDHVQPQLTLRAGANTGYAAPAAGNYVTLEVNLAARVAAAASGGQLLVTAATVDALTDTGLRATAGETVGEFTLKGIPGPTALWRLCGPDEAPRAVPARKTNVATPLTSFIGRRGEIKSLRDDIDHHRLVTVLGPGGVGKTRLMSEFALAHGDRWPGGAWLVELASVTDGDQALTAAGAALGATVRSLDDLARATQRNGDTLLILDNCEHLLDPVADMVWNLLSHTDGTRVVCTSREALRLTEEKVWRLGPLEAVDDRFALFKARADSAGATIADPDLDVVLDLCDRLDGLPLAIELAAAHSADTPLSALLDVIAAGSDPLPRRGGQPRQGSLDAVVAWSVDRLSPADRDALLVLSTFPGRMTHEMAVTVLDALPRRDGFHASGALRMLVRSSLLDLDGDQYRLLETIRAAARRLLDVDRELTRAAGDALQKWAIEFATRHDRRVEGLDFVLDDQVLALEDVLERGQAQRFAGLGEVWDLVAALATIRKTNARIVALATDNLAELAVVDEDSALTIAAAIHIVTGTVGAGRGPLDVDQLNALVEAADRTATGRGARTLRRTVAFECAWIGDVDAARRHFEALVRNADSDQPGYDYDLALAHSVGALIASVEEDAVEYEKHSTAALEAILRHDAEFYQRNVYEANAADALLRIGQPKRALDHGTEALRRTASDEAIRGHILRLMADAHWQLGQREDALVVGREAERFLHERVNESPQFGRTLAALREAVPALSDMNIDTSH